MAYYKASEVRLNYRVRDVQKYSWGDRWLRFVRCRTCGCFMHWEQVKGKRRDRMGAGDLLDAEAKEAYRRRLADIEEDIREASEFGDQERVFQAEQERDFLVRELARAFGLGGRARSAGAGVRRIRPGQGRGYARRRTRLALAGSDLPARLP